MARDGKVVRYIGIRLGVLVLLVGLLFSAFFSSMKTSNLYFMMQDAWKARLDVVLLGQNMDNYDKFFTQKYLSNAEYSTIRDKYSIYIISNYGDELHFKNTFVWPWQTRKTVTVQEAVYAINGSLNTETMSKADALAQGVADVPEWDNTTYRVTLVYEKGKWLIDSITSKGKYSYKPAETHYLSEKEIEALRTAVPTASPVPSPTEVGATPPPLHDAATISTAISGTTVNVRKGPSMGYETIEELKGGDKVTVIGETDGWYQVILSDNKTKGYVSKVYVIFD